MGIRINQTINLQKLLYAVFAGFIAITANTLLLKAAPLINIQAESGGLLKLVFNWLPNVLQRSMFLHGILFWIIFHYFIGYCMAFLYIMAYQRLPGSGMTKGGMFSLLPWLINGFLVLPILNQGLIGIKTLSATGIIYFFIANLIFGLVLGGIYEYLNTRNQ